MAVKAAVAWHDVECHSYVADLPLWRRLAEQEGSPVLDVGAGTGRVALDLAAAGHEVVALDLDGELLEALQERAAAAGVTVETLIADAQDFDAGVGRFALVLVPMQTIQLLTDRPAFLRAARRALRRGGLLAIAIADELSPFDPSPGVLPDPDVAELDGWRYVSQPTAVRVGREWSRIERLRIAHAPDGRRTTEANVIELAVLDAPALAAEGRAAGLTSVPGERIASTPDHVATAVVVFRA
jgi:SAM-dependent methyltransferase